MSTLAIPLVTVQHDFQSVINDVKDSLGVTRDKFWVSCYRKGERSVHGSVDVVRTSDGVEFVGNDGVTIEQRNDNNFVVGCQELGIRDALLRVPRSSIRPDAHKKITAIAVSPDTRQLSTGHEDGSITLHQIPPSPNVNDHHRTTKSIHVASISSLKFFPSSSVLLSSSSDFSLSILSADLSSSPPSSTSAPLTRVRHLKAHRRPITSSIIFGRGRTIASGSLDGSIRLWDLSQGVQTRMIGSTSY
ncbi:WD40 repeat-like protein, partial [Sistotremastrum niveocremeum HHB9708]